MGGTVALFAHRVTPTLGLAHGPFRYIDRLERGDRIIVRMPYGRYVYRVRGHRVVKADAWSAFRPRLGRDVLLLAACHPPDSSAYRYIVQAARRFVR
jgi:sortase A